MNFWNYEKYSWFEIGEIYRFACTAQFMIPVTVLFDVCLFDAEKTSASERNMQLFEIIVCSLDKCVVIYNQMINPINEMCTLFGGKCSP